MSASRRVRADQLHAGLPSGQHPLVHVRYADRAGVAGTAVVCPGGIAGRGGLAGGEGTASTDVQHPRADRHQPAPVNLRHVRRPAHGGFTRTPSSLAASGISAGARAPDGVTRRPVGPVQDASDLAACIRTHRPASTAAAWTPWSRRPSGVSEGTLSDVPEGIDLPYRRPGATLIEHARVRRTGQRAVAEGKGR